jgi:hypothetical protein
MLYVRDTTRITWFGHCASCRSIFELDDLANPVVDRTPSGLTLLAWFVVFVVVCAVAEAI